MTSQLITDPLQYQGDIPAARFGHTITLVNKNIAVLFGGAIGDTGKYTITGDTYTCDIINKKWKKLTPTGNAPSNRAAHQSLCIDQLQMVIFGGAIGGGGLADDNLHALDLKQGEEASIWMQIPVVGNTPGRRYGHTMVYIKPYILVHGGNTGAEPVNDVWTLNLEKGPYNWVKLECGNEVPVVRVYHSAALCSTGSANGMMVIFGGRTADQSALNDTWGLRRHRDGRWDWVKAPYKSQGELPTHRYQHSTIFIGSLMFVLGGRSNQVGEVLPFEIYDTESSDWFKFPSLQRFRHAIWSIEQYLYVHGGFDQETPNIPTDSMLRIDLNKLFLQHQNLQKSLTFHLNKDSSKTIGIDYKKVVQPQSPSLNQAGNENQMEPEQVMAQFSMVAQQQMPIQQQQQQQMQQLNQPISEIMKAQNILAQGQNRIPKLNQNSNQKNIRLSHQAVVAQTYSPDEELNRLVKKVSIDKLVEEKKKLKVGYNDPNQNSKQIQLEILYNVFIQNLLVPKDYQLIQSSTNFFSSIKKDVIIKLCDEVQRIFEREPMVLKIKAPLKIFGNINGQFTDLMKFFFHYGTPSDYQDCMCDIDGVDYLFLGDYVDRGTRSLETLLLLFALKLKYPDSISMLRGHHEDRRINKFQGFADECMLKFQEDPNDAQSIYQRINKVFDYMPLAALADDKIFCLHGGIGTQLRSIEEIEMITKPLEIIHDPKTINQKIALELLWSDPVQDDEELENQINLEHDVFGFKHVSRFGNGRINKFMIDNNLTLIIRSHEPVIEGFEQMNNIITIFSATDYCGKMQNAASLINVTKNLLINPKVINSAQQGSYSSEERWLNLEDLTLKKKLMVQQKNQIIENEEMQLRKRPPTPIRRYMSK